MLEKTQAQQLMADIVKQVESLMNIINQFEDSRPTEKAFTKLEEAIMWMNVMVNNVSKKKLEVAA